jgi:hypothetical protein
MGLGQLQAMDRAVWQPQGASAIDTGEMVLIPLRGREEGFSAGEMAAAHQAPLLQLPQVAIHRGQAHGPLPCAEAGVEILAGEFIIGLPQHRQQVLLAGWQPGGGKAGGSHCREGVLRRGNGGWGRGWVMRRGIGGSETGKRRGREE